MIDAHAHLSDERMANVAIPFSKDLQANGLSHLILGGVDPVEWQRQLSMTRLDPKFITPVIGIHPWTVRDRTSDELEAMFEELETLAPQAVAIGETGLDFHSTADAAVQRMKQPHWCERQLDLAYRLEKPVVLHVVKAHDGMHKLLKHYRGKPGIVHGWHGNPQDGQKYIDRAFVLSIGPRSIGRLKPKDLSWIPRENFVLESDAPDVASKQTALPTAKEWTSALSRVATFLAKSFGILTDEVWALNRDNLQRIFERDF